MAHENKTHVWPSWCTNPVIDPTGAYRTRDGQCQWCGGTHFGSGVCPYSPAYKEPETKASAAHEKGTEIPEDLREHYKACGEYQNAHLIFCRQLIERIAALTLDNERLRELHADIACAMATLLTFDKISAIQANVEEVTKARRLERSTP